MIRAYTTNPENAAALEAAARARGYPLQIQVEFDLEALEAALPELAVLVLDLDDPAFAAERIVPQLDALDAELPPVLYILTGAQQISFVAAVEHIVNQDYTFSPVTPEALALRLEVLTLLGQRRRMTLESAITDKLTGLFNRKYFLRRVEEELFRAQRYGYGVGLVFADIDFSANGGQLGESDGTVAIQAVADFLQDRLRKTDVVARFRWSQFAVLLPNIPAEDSLAVARDLKQKVEALEVQTDGHSVSLSAAVGHLLLPLETLPTALQALQAVEDSAFAARSAGAGEVMDYTP